VLYGHISDHEGYVKDFMSLMQAQASKEVTGTKQVWVGYISEYDPIRHAVKVLNPLAGDVPAANQFQNAGAPQTGTPLEYGMIPLASQFVGIANGTNPVNDLVEHPGIQICPLGGATAQNPTAGEQCVVINLNNEIGYATCAFLLFNEIALPPGGNIPVLGTAMQPGEWLFVTPTGTTIYMDIDGNLTVMVRQAGHDEGDLNVTANGGISIATVADGTVPTAADVGDIDITSVRDINEDAGRDHTETAVRDITEESTRDITRTAGRNIVDGATGFVTIQGGTNVLVEAGLNLQIDANGIITINSPVAINAGSIGLTYLPLITAFFLTLYNSHSHSGVQTGAGVSGPPVIAAVPTYPVTTKTFYAN
jgi:hypothetical protein